MKPRFKSKFNLKIDNQQINNLWNNKLDEQFSYYWIKVKNDEKIENQKSIGGIIEDKDILKITSSDTKKNKFLQLINLIYHQYLYKKDNINILELIKDDKELVSFR